MITPQELKQLNAYVRYDGFALGALMALTFIFMIQSFAHPELQLAGLACLIGTPIFVGARIAHYRDKVVKARVSYRRAAYYSAQCFLYGALVLAIVVYIYMRFFDGGAFYAAIIETISKPEMEPVMKQYGMTINDLRDAFAEQRPIDMALSLITNVLFSGIIASLVIAACVRREKKG